jgi:hypothetical protein
MTSSAKTIDTLKRGFMLESMPQIASGRQTARDALFNRKETVRP